MLESPTIAGLPPRPPEIEQYYRRVVAAAVQSDDPVGAVAAVPVPESLRALCQPIVVPDEAPGASDPTHARVGSSDAAGGGDAGGGVRLPLHHPLVWVRVFYPPPASLVAIVRAVDRFLIHYGRALTPTQRAAPLSADVFCMRNSFDAGAASHRPLIYYVIFALVRVLTRRIFVVRGRGSSVLVRRSACR